MRKRGNGAYTDRKSTRLNSSHLVISYAVFCLKKKTLHRATHVTSVRAPSPRARLSLRACQRAHVSGCHWCVKLSAGRLPAVVAIFFFLVRGPPPIPPLFPDRPLFR